MNNFYKKAAFMMCGLPAAVLALSCVLPICVWGSAAGPNLESKAGDGKRPEEQITVQSELLTEGTSFVPNDIYTDEEGNEYELRSWTMVPVPVDEREKTIQEQVIYRDVELRKEIPEEYEVQITDERTGGKQAETFPLLSTTEIGDRWVEDFSFSVTFHSYDAEYYVLGDQTIPFDEEVPQLAGHENELLMMIGVDPDSYRIGNISWDGEPYEDQTGVLCRDALASGARHIRDYQAVYGGTITFPETEGILCEAVYERAGIKWKEASDVVVEPEQVIHQEGEESDDVNVWMIFRRGIVVTVSLFLVLFLIILMLFLWKKRREKIYGGTNIRKRRKQEEETTGTYGSGYDAGVSDPMQ